MDQELEDLRSIERALLRIEDSFESDDFECNILLEIADVGAWIVKFRKNGMVFNNRDLVISDIINIDTTIQFKSVNTFWEAMNNVSGDGIDFSISKNHATLTGSQDAAKQLQRKLNKQSDNSTQISNMATPQKFNITLASGESLQPLKVGWLLKKRDIITGWRCRYFVVYPGRVEYYIDENEQYPRDSVSLQDATIIGPKKCTVNHTSDHYSITVDPKVGGRTLRLATEKTGDEGLADSTAWYQVFLQAKQLSDNTTNVNANTQENVPKDKIKSNRKILGIFGNNNSSNNTSSGFHINTILSNSNNQTGPGSAGSNGNIGNSGNNNATNNSNANNSKEASSSQRGQLGTPSLIQKGMGLIAKTKSSILQSASKDSNEQRKHSELQSTDGISSNQAKDYQWDVVMSFSLFHVVIIVLILSFFVTRFIQLTNVISLISMELLKRRLLPSLEVTDDVEQLLVYVIVLIVSMPLLFVPYKISITKKVYL